MDSMTPRRKNNRPIAYMRAVIFYKNFVTNSEFLRLIYEIGKEVSDSEYRKTVQNILHEGIFICGESYEKLVSS